MPSSMITWLPSTGSTEVLSPPQQLLHTYYICKHFTCITTAIIQPMTTLPGKLNTMANDCSWLWHLLDNDLLIHFNLHYPQAGGWTLCHLSSMTHSALISALQCKQLMPELYLPGHLPLTATGPSGQPSVWTSTLTPIFPTHPSTSYSSSGSLLCTTAPDDLPPVVGWSSLALWKMPSISGPDAGPTGDPGPLA